ncbi:GAF domain-containing protein [Geodermatophilus tzadiensis]|uniref:GAF domain-containing protein n=1 Tax=Geodermatophilus tzadiensis TaxID=1137988 RepID=A0A2T0TPA6_9ACTN|nr:GAF and ANTAR domain-containing protein [Geodermatophilus tzadiensis]PRY47483.1 GAF domain-containing protein [Geodermatophilus tzadiensis]
MEELLRDLARITQVGRPVGDVLTDIVQAGERGIPGAEAASVTLLRGDTASTAAYSGEMALHAEELEYERGHGPCLDAGRGGVVLRVDDMGSEQRWPDYAARVTEVGVRSSLSLPLPFQGAVIGALNTYSTQPGAFASDEVLDAAATMAEVVAVAVANAHEHARLGDEAAQLRLAMQSRAVIEQAKGVLMAQHRVDAERAFEILREASMRYNRKLRDIAAGIVESVQRPDR